MQQDDDTTSDTFIRTILGGMLRFLRDSLLPGMSYVLSQFIMKMDFLRTLIYVVYTIVLNFIIINLLWKVILYIYFYLSVITMPHSVNKGGSSRH